LGLKPTEIEKSIQNAYIELIRDSKHFIYIENQFFVSGVSGKAVKNRIAEALIDRIKGAHQRNEHFKVAVVLPLLPGFEGEIYEKSSNVMRIQLSWEYRTINRGKRSIMEQYPIPNKRLKKAGIEDPSKYIQFFGLRNHGKSKIGEPKTEMVYIHSKVRTLVTNSAS